MASRPKAERPSEGAGRRRDGKRKALTIGAVASILEQEFDDISISKIRYLEDQKLLAPRRTASGYRLYSQEDVDRLRAILRMQRDEFLPLRVIRRELASGPRATVGRSQATRPMGLADDLSERLTFAELAEETGISREFADELAGYGILDPVKADGGEVLYDLTDRDIARACVELGRFGVHGRNLRVFRSSADREAGLLEQVLGPSLQTHNPSRRREALDNLESLAAVAGSLKHLLLIRDLRRLIGTS